MFFQGIGEEEQLVLEANGPGMRDALGEEVTRALRHRATREAGQRRLRTGSLSL